MKEATRHTFVWGWLRMALGVGQMSFVMVSIIALVFGGLQRSTYILAAIATGLTLTSRVLYRGEKDPKLSLRTHNRNRSRKM